MMALAKVRGGNGSRKSNVLEAQKAMLQILILTTAVVAIGMAILAVTAVIVESRNDRGDRQKSP